MRRATTGEATLSKRLKAHAGRLGLNTSFGRGEGESKGEDESADLKEGRGDQSIADWRIFKTKIVKYLGTVALQIFGNDLKSIQFILS